ncbi:MAG: divalent cation tolerance protein CutA [Patescibacteria group bacterium]|jgi:uncharacterized protein involved in tolerance to divalent cations
MKPSIYLLFCTSKKEAEKIREVLLEKRLIVCGGTIDIKHSKYWWKRLIEVASDEVLLLMESQEENLLVIEKEVRKYHSHKTFVLMALPIKTTVDVKKWLKEELK